MSCWMITDAHADMLATAAVQFLGAAPSFAQTFGESLLAANVLSVTARYEERHGLAADGRAQLAAYRYRKWMGNIDPADLFVQVRCAEYQCDEWDDFAGSVIASLLRDLVAATGLDPEHMPEGYAWGIDCHPGEALELELEPEHPEPLPRVPVLERAEAQGAFAFRW